MEIDHWKAWLDNHVPILTLFRFSFHFIIPCAHNLGLWYACCYNYLYLKITVLFGESRRMLFSSPGFVRWRATSYSCGFTVNRYCYHHHHPHNHISTFTPLVFSSTREMAPECKRYHSRLAELLATKKGESYATTTSWIRARVPFALLRSASLCLRGLRAKRKIHLELPDIDFDIQREHANIRWKHWRQYFISYFLSFFVVDLRIWS